MSDRESAPTPFRPPSPGEHSEPPAAPDGDRPLPPESGTDTSIGTPAIPSPVDPL